MFLSISCACDFFDCEFHQDKEKLIKADKSCWLTIDSQMDFFMLKKRCKKTSLCPFAYHSHECCNYLSINSFPSLLMLVIADTHYSYAFMHQRIGFLGHLYNHVFNYLPFYVCISLHPIFISIFLHSCTVHSHAKRF